MSDRRLVLHISGMRLRRGSGEDVEQLGEVELLPGTLTLVMGPNGAGKTTLLEKLAGLRDPEDLSVCYGREPLWLRRKLWRGSRLNRAALLSYGYAPQNPEHALFARKVQEELAYSLRPYADQAADQGKAMERALAAVGFDGSWLARDPARMSGGERRRTALASLFVTPAPWLLLDEPTAGLDREGHERVGAHLVDLKKEGRGIVLISHDSEWALPLANQVLLVYMNGEIRSCKPEELVAHPEWLEEAGMQVPGWLWPVREAYCAGVSLHKLWNPAEAAEVMAGIPSVYFPGNRELADREERLSVNPSFSERARRHSAHRLTRFDPRAVWLGYALVSAGLFSLSNWISLAVGAVIVLSLLWAGHVSLARWRGVIGSFVYFMLFMSGFAAVAKTGDGRWWDTEAFVGTLFPLTRTLLVMLIGLGLPLVMTPLSLRRSLEQLVSWRGRTSSFWQRFLLTVTLLIRFVPELLVEWERFKRIFLARGKETAKTPLVLFRRLRGVSLPLLLALFRLGDDVAIALESRGVRKDVHPTRGTRLMWKWADTCLVAGAAFIAGVFLLYG
ncbi:ATP-binding cassette domain-containing protein [Cohnella pontilimi]|nr:ATP-binding cassette domain-containing protein [Cohnella pontilimi]